MKWLEKNMVVTAARVIDLVSDQRNFTRTESMLTVCGDLFDLNPMHLSMKITKHVSRCMCLYRGICVLHVSRCMCLYRGICVLHVSRCMCLYRGMKLKLRFVVVVMYVVNRPD